MSQLKPIGAANFKSEVLESALPVIADFYVDRRSPGRLLGPIFDRLACFLSKATP